MDKILNTHANRRRGRPKEILTSEQILALKNKPIRSRGRPKKQFTKEEILAIQLSKERGKGRPKKQLCPRDEWFLKFAPKREKGRPKKNEVLEIALPQINLAPIQGQSPSLQSHIAYEQQWQRNIGNKLMPKLSWQEFKDKLSLTDLTENYLFPIIEASQKNEPKLKKKMAVKYSDKPSKYVVDLRSSAEKIFEPEEKYAWEQKEKSVPLDFDTPADLEDEAIQFTHGVKHKNKRKVSLLAKRKSAVAVKEKNAILDKSLVGFGKFLYFVWRAITAPFRFLDWLVDTSLKLIWKAVIGLLKFNFNYLKNLRKINFRQVNFATVKPLAIFVLLVLIVVIPVWAFDSYHQVQKIKKDVLGVSSQGIDYLTQGDFSSAENSFQQAQNEFASLGSLNNWFLQLVPQVNSGQKLLRAGELAAVIGQKISSALNLFDNSSQQESEICQGLPGADQKCSTYSELNLTDKLQYVKNTLNSQQANIDELISIISNTDVESVPKEYQDKLQEVKNNVLNLNNINKELNSLLEFLLKFLGADQPQRYLIIFQNSSEIRPTGGFMGSFALVDIYHGNVQKMDIPGGGLYDLKGSNKVLVQAPKPLQIFSPAWQIWNANWFPDWPTSARKIMWFYENNTGGSSVDGVLALNQDVVADMLALTGPVEMPDYNKILSTDNFVNEVQMAVEYEYNKEANQPKQIIADLAPELLQKIIDLHQQDFLKALALFNKSLSQEKILFYFNNQTIQQTAQDFGWSGSMKYATEDQDYLLIVHTNISGGKSDAVIQNKVQHKIEIQSDGTLLATVSLTRQHNGDLTKLFEQDNNVDYVRFYVPAGSKFVSASGFNFNPDYLFKYAAVDYQNLKIDEDIKAEENEVSIDEKSRTRIGKEFNKTVFGNWIQVAPGQEVTTEIKYILPFKFETSDKSSNLKKWIAAVFGSDKQYKYSIVVQKQLGMDAIDFSSQLVLPHGFEVVKTIKSDNFSQNNTQFSSSLQENGYYGIIIK